jgi:hypothetical protein
VDQDLTSTPQRLRRLRDKLVARETDQGRLVGRADVANLLMLIDDDLRETADAMNGIEGFLAEALRLLDADDLRAPELLRLCADDGVLERMDTLAEALATLRRRFGALAATIR